MANGSSTVTAKNEKFTVVALPSTVGGPRKNSEESVVNPLPVMLTLRLFRSTVSEKPLVMVPLKVTVWPGAAGNVGESKLMVSDAAAAVATLRTREKMSLSIREFLFVGARGGDGFSAVPMLTSVTEPPRGRRC
ncbi:MAG: hypothetical protein JNK87_42695 [Bryobacterales bacterium]|nr:hypothetical protein [Bryobacterales bacterium]